MAPRKPTATNINITSSSIVRLIIWGLVIVCLIALKELVLVLLTAIVVASFVGGAAERFHKYKIHRTLTVVGIYFIVISLLAGIFYLFAPILITEIGHVIDIISPYIPSSDLLNSFKGGVSLTDGANSLINGGSLPTIIENSNIGNVGGGFFQSITSLFGGIANFILIIVISFYLSIERDGISKFLQIVVPASHEDYAIDLWKRTQRKIALWMQGQLVLGLLVGVLTYLGLSILGVQYALLLALIAGIMELIPFGIILAAIPAIAFGYLDGGITMALLVAGFYTIVQQFENYLIAPLVVQKATGVSPLVVILSVLVGAQLAGFWGLILAVPVAVAVLEYANDVEKNKVIAKAKPVAETSSS
jgi:predicted PurR-regulated permease PerM